MQRLQTLLDARDQQLDALQKQLKEQQSIQTPLPTTHASTTISIILQELKSIPPPQINRQQSQLLLQQAEQTVHEVIQFFDAQPNDDQVPAETSSF
eukprot:m.261112 g.261112  ORF g.261112 m.261112 type:complete len:96 (+) comp26780_c1_seq37:813-1100(+)